MQFLFSQMGRYLFAQTFLSIGVALAAVGAVILLVDVVEQLRTFGDRVELSLFDAMSLTALKAPMLLEQTLPFVVLAGVMIAIVRLNRRSELIALRASGVSAWRFLGPATTAALLLGLFTVFLVNPAGAALYERFEAEKAALLGESAVADPNAIVWLRQGDAAQQMVIEARRSPRDPATLAPANFLIFEPGEDGAFHFTRRLEALSAELKPGFWQLRGVKESTPGGAVTAVDVLSIETVIQRKALIDSLTPPSTLSFWRLPAFIADSRAAGLAPYRYELEWHNLLALPALLAAMAALGAVFSLRLQRLGGLATWTLIGISAGFAVFFSGQLAAAFAATQVVPPAVAAWSPPLTGFFAALAVLAFVEDG
jgi:lipopolysaccharide export system permease protein